MVCARLVSGMINGLLINRRQVHRAIPGVHIPKIPNPQYSAARRGYAGAVKATLAMIGEGW